MKDENSMAQKSILLVVENLPVPYDRRVWQEALALKKAGWRVHVVSPATARHPKLFESIDGIRICRYPMLVEGKGHLGLILEYVWSFFCIFLLTLFVAAFRGFDVIVCANPPDIFFPVLAMWRMAGKATVFDHHDLTPELFITKFNAPSAIILKFFYFCERQTLRVVHKVMTTNESYRKIDMERGRRRSEDVVVVRNSPDPTRFSIRGPEQELKKSAKILIAFLGEIGNQDGVDVLIRAVKEINRRLGDGAAHCVLMGGGPDYARIVSYARSTGVSDSITFTGRADNDMICRVLSTADIAVDPCPFSPHADISTATKIMEYMFFSLPIVAFGLTETKRSGGDSVRYANVGEEADFAEKIIELIGSNEMREDFGRRGRQRLDEVLSWQRSAESLVTLMDSFVEPSRALPTPLGAAPPIVQPLVQTIARTVSGAQ